MRGRESDLAMVEGPESILDDQKSGTDAGLYRYQLEVGRYT